MTLSRFCRMIVTIASVSFLGLALTIWAVPEQAAARVGLAAVRPLGLNAVRSELGGLFAGLALLCAGAAWTAGKAWTRTAASMLGAIAAARLLAWIVDPEGGIEIAALAVEMGVAAALLGIAVDSAVGSAPVPPRPRARRRLSPIVAGLAVIVAGGTVAALSPDLQQRVFDTAARARAGSVRTAPLQDDALRVAICGSSAPLPSAARAKACVAVFAGGKFYVVDVGPESVENLVLWGVPLSSIGGVFLTHFHSDHIGDLGELNLQTWAAGRPEPLTVFGGPGVDDVVDGFNAAYRLDQGYRTAHHTATVMPPSTWPMQPHAIVLPGPGTAAKDRRGIALQLGDLRVTAIEVNHAPIAPAYAYRFDYKGRSAVVTGDLKDHPPLVAAAMGADVLVSEAISTTMTRSLGEGARAAGRSNTAAIMHDIEDYHITPEQAARIANEAHVSLLAFYHLLPAPDGMLARRVFARGIDEVRVGDWTIADDGSLYTLPIGSKAVHIGGMED